MNWRLRTRGTFTCAGDAVSGRPEPSADLLRQHDDDPLRAADVAEPIAVFVARHLANEFRAAGVRASDGGVDVVDGKCEPRPGCTPGVAVVDGLVGWWGCAAYWSEETSDGCPAQSGHSWVREPMEDAH